MTLGGDHVAKVWDANTGEQLVVLRGHTGPVTGAGFTPDGARVLTCSGDRSLRAWDAKTGWEAFALTATGFGVADLAVTASNCNQRPVRNRLQTALARRRT